MNRLRRLLLLCLLALALPLQGLAAAGVLPCASGHLPGTHAGMNAGMAAGLHPGAEAHADCHGEAAGPATAAASSSATDPAQDLTQDLTQDPVPAAAHKCSACAACGTGVALPASAPVLPLSGPGSAPVLSLEVATASFIASGLERPPRSRLA